MAQVTPAEARDYLARLALAGEYEIEELRNTPVETKLRQIWTLMGSAALFEDSAQRQADFRETRARWARLHQAFCD